MMARNNILIFQLTCCMLVTINFALPPLPISLGTFPAKHAAFCNLANFSPDSPTLELSLLISSFSGVPFSTDEVFVVYNISSKMGDVQEIKPSVLTKAITWPNEARRVPTEVFGNTNTVVVSGGFLPPTKTNGEVALFTVDEITGKSQGPYQISQTKKSFFYHTALWYDIDQDGLLDCVTARASVSSSTDYVGELIWYKQPSSSPLSGEWAENFIGYGPDVFIEFIQLEGNSSIQIIATQFFSAELSIWWSPDNTWSNETVQSRVIDNTLGSAFDLQVVDINADGKLDLLVTNHENNATFSSLYAYEIPVNWQTDPWPRYILSNNITTLKKGNNQASPGAATAFYPNINDKSGKPLIIMAGDGSEMAYLISANSESTSDWTYTRQTIVYTQNTVGQIAVGDVTGDGFVEAFIPAYEDGLVYVYSFSNYIDY